MSFKKLGTSIICTLSLLLATACSDGRSISRSGTTPISQDFYSWYTTWQSSDTETHLYIALRDSAGKVEVCGAVITNGTALLRSTEPQFLNNNYLKVNNQTILNSLYFFNRLPAQEGEFDVWNSMGQTANCAVSDVAWQNGMEAGKIEFGSRSGRVRL